MCLANNRVGEPVREVVGRIHDSGVDPVILLKAVDARGRDCPKPTGSGRQGVRLGGGEPEEASG